MCPSRVDWNKGISQNYKNNKLIKLSGVINYKILRVGDGDFNLDAGLDGDGSNLLHNVRRAEEIDHTLVNSELKHVPRVSTFENEYEFKRLNNNIMYSELSN